MYIKTTSNTTTRCKLGSHHCKPSWGIIDTRGPFPFHGNQPAFVEPHPDRHQPNHPPSHYLHGCLQGTLNHFLAQACPTSSTRLVIYLCVCRCIGPSRHLRGQPFPNGICGPDCEDVVLPLGQQDGGRRLRPPRRRIVRHHRGGECTDRKRPGGRVLGLWHSAPTRSAP